MINARFNAPPGWPTPPEGWVPDPQWQPDPSWPAPPAGWQWWVVDQPVSAFAPPPPAPMPQPPATPWSPPGLQPVAWVTDPSGPAGSWELPTAPPRAKAMRVLLTLLIVLTPLLAVGVITIVLAGAIDPADYATVEEFDQAWSDASNNLSVVLMIGYLVAYALLARQVSFRWFDTFLLLIPVYGIVWQFRIAHRLAHLPHRDWAPRPDEPLPAHAMSGGWSHTPTYAGSPAPPGDPFGTPR
jgi:hypothetical protein